MPTMPVRVSGPPEPARAAIEALRLRLGLPDALPAVVLAEAEEAAARRPEGYADLTDVEFVTIDPAASKDLDQALHVARDGAVGELPDHPARLHKPCVPHMHHQVPPSSRIRRPQPADEAPGTQRHDARTCLGHP